MSEISRVALFGKLNTIGYKAIESATVFCKLRGNPYVELVHWFHQILQLQDSDLHRIMREFQIDPCDLIPGWDVCHELIQMRQRQTLRREGHPWLRDDLRPMDVIDQCAPCLRGYEDNLLPGQLLDQVPGHGMGGVPTKKGHHTDGELRHLESAPGVGDGRTTVPLQDGIDIRP